LQFSFSGQSIPNRGDIKVEKGVKIYFDAVETTARVNQNVILVKKVFNEADNVRTSAIYHTPITTHY
jgi:hypothetical protein